MSTLKANLRLLLLFHPLMITALLRTVSAIAKVGVIACLSLDLSSAQRPQFEVASVKPNTPNSPFDLTPRRSGDRIIMHGELGPMVAYAYHVEPGYPLEGDLSLPDGWNWYDIDAKVAGSPSDDEIRLMFQTLLEERFKLKGHRETKEVPVYTLTQTRKGPKLKQRTEGAPPQRIIGRVLPDGIVGNFSRREDPHHIVGRKAPMARLASYLTRMLQVPVMDQTGLAGDFDFELTWESDDPPLAPPDPALVAAVLQEQLGLKLEKRKRSVEILVVDHVEKPSEN
jgi:uncharacterized protein (TIGR03435 family)